MAKYITLFTFIVTLFTLNNAFANTYTRIDQKNDLTLYQKDDLSFTFGGVMQGSYFRDMQDYYSDHEVLRRDNYMILGQFNLAATYNINDYSSLTGFISTNLNYAAERQIDSPFTANQQYLVYSNNYIGDFSFGNVDGLYEEVALWSDVTTNFGGVAHVSTFDPPVLNGLDNAYNTIQYRKNINNITIGAEFTTPDVSYRTGGVSLPHSDPNHNFRAGMERKEAGGASLVYDNGVFGLGAVYHYARVAHTHNQPNTDGDEIRSIKYHDIINNGVLSAKLTQGKWYYATGVSFEHVIGAWRGDSSIGPLVKRFNRYGFSAAVSYDARKNFVGFVPSLEYDYSKAHQKSGINEATANDTSIGNNTSNYLFPPYSPVNDLSSNRADPYNTNKVIASTSYYLNKLASVYVALAFDLRPKSQIHNSSGNDKIRENQFATGIRLTF
ncbi:hypothetical protein ACFX5K_05600 [Rickettsiales bacterium LUAb2]